MKLFHEGLTKAILAQPNHDPNCDDRKELIQRLLKQMNDTE